MAINFNSLPTEKPSVGQIIPKGTYTGTIKKAEMKQGKDETKPPYLNLQIECVDPVSNTNMGNVFVNLTESDKALPLYQLSRFIKALNLPITGDFELRDLTKMVVNKQLKIDVCPEDKEEPRWSQLDISAQCFYPLKSETETVAEAATEVFSAQPAMEQAPAPMSSY